MIYMCLRYRVADFRKWHETFVENESLRIAAGIKVENILRSQNDKNFLTILYSVNSIDESEAFIAKVKNADMLKKLTVESEMLVEYFDLFY